MECEKCGLAIAADDLVVVQVLAATRYSPAESEAYHADCLPYDARNDPDYDEVYERAAARYDGKGKDWR